MIVLAKLSCRLFLFLPRVACRSRELSIDSYQERADQLDEERIRRTQSTMVRFMTYHDSCVPTLYCSAKFMTQVKNYTLPKSYQQGPGMRVHAKRYLKFRTALFSEQYALHHPPLSDNQGMNNGIPAPPQTLYKKASSK